LEAARAAIACPLLEDVNLKGARGILVNVTAGPDLGLEEFSAVGEAIGEFASDNALVVVGTAMDESVGEELRVTVVATGLGQHEALKTEKEMRLVVPQRGSDPDYRRFDMPTVMRRQPPAREEVEVETVTDLSASKDDPDYLDIPAFLRRQAD